MDSNESAEELGALLGSLLLGLQGLVDILEGADPQHSVRAGGLRALLLPLADEAAQAHALAVVLTGPQRLS